MAIPDISQGPYLTLDTIVTVLRAGLDTACGEIETELADAITLPRIGTSTHLVQAGDVLGLDPQGYPSVRVVTESVRYVTDGPLGLAELYHRIVVRAYLQSVDADTPEVSTTALLERRTHLYEGAIRRVVERDAKPAGVNWILPVATRYLEPAPNAKSRRAITQVVEVVFEAYQRVRRSHFTA